MLRQLSLHIGSAALVAMLSLPASAQEYSNGGNCKKGRKEATKTPVEAFGVHPPGPDPADLNRCVFCWWKYTYIPYYSPLAPIATSIRWKPWCYFPLLPYYTPYYIGYCPHRLHCPKPLPYGYDGGWGDGPSPDHPIPPPAEYAPLGYGAYTSIITDDTIFWNMGGNGLVPYGTPRPPHGGSPDLVDAIQVSRQQGYGGCPAVLGAPPMMAPAVLPPGEQAGGNEGEKTDPNNKGTLPPILRPISPQ
jgi:hypothetical protein